MAFYTIIKHNTDMTLRHTSYHKAMRIKHFYTALSVISAKKTK